MGELTTLDKIDAIFSEEDKTRRNILLLLASHLSSLQLNIALEIEQIYRKNNVYGFTIKHNHEKIKKMIRDNNSGVFFSRMNNDQAYAYAEDGEDFERLVYTWAGLEHPSGKDGMIRAVNLNLAAREAWECAVARGKIKGMGRVIAPLQIAKIKEEVRELFEASNNQSIHIPYTEQQEEAIDVIISTLTLLHGQGIDINTLLEAKMDYNARRTD